VGEDHSEVADLGDDEEDGVDMAGCVGVHDGMGNGE
jgi:hypothetical protein